MVSRYSQGGGYKALNTLAFTKAGCQYLFWLVVPETIGRFSQGLWVPPQVLQNSIKGTGHDFCWSGKPIYHLQKQGNIHIFQNK